MEDPKKAKKSVTLKVNVSPDEKQLIEGYAKKQNLSISAYMCKKALDTSKTVNDLEAILGRHIHSIYHAIDQIPDRTLRQYMRGAVRNLWHALN